MIQATAKVDGMSCGMCEAHVNDAIRKAFPDAKKVNASRTKKQVTFVLENPIDENLLRQTIEATGYHYQGVETEEYVKKGLFGFGKR